MAPNHQESPGTTWGTLQPPATVSQTCTPFKAAWDLTLNYAKPAFVLGQQFEVVSSCKFVTASVTIISHLQERRCQQKKCIKRGESKPLRHLTALLTNLPGSSGIFRVESMGEKKTLLPLTCALAFHAPCKVTCVGKNYSKDLEDSCRKDWLIGQIAHCLNDRPISIEFLKRGQIEAFSRAKLM